MTILGICDNHDAGAAIISDGEIIAAVNEERLNRKKCSGGFPYLSIQKVFEIANLDISKIDLIALASDMTPASFMRLFRSFHSNLREDLSQFSYLLNLYIIYQVFAHKLYLPQGIESYLSALITKFKLSKLGLKAKVVTIDHHLSHGFSVFKTSGFDKAIIFTIDAMGDGLSVTVNIGSKDGSIKRIYAQSGFSGINTYYSRITEFLGFKPVRDEGKITGLAAYSNQSCNLNLAKSLLKYSGKGFRYNNYFLRQSKHDGLYREFKKIKKEDVAYLVQKNLEEEVLKFISYWINLTDIHNVALSGGLFANVKLNQRIHELSTVENIYIFPHMGDGGNAVGAALALTKNNPTVLTNIYLGPDSPNKEIYSLLNNNSYQLKFKYYENIERKIAELLNEGSVVARFNGRMEYGPRALGNRSILYRPDDPTVKDWLNKKLKRTEFMPFSPTTLKEYASKLYCNTNGAEYTSKFMNISFNCSSWMKKNCPGAVHIDDTARPQILSYEDNPSFYKIIDYYREFSGIPTIINTSFNMHEEPIVCTPQEAVDAFVRAKLGYLAIGNFLVKRG